MKIVYCTNTLGLCGGVERVTILKANALAEIEGNEVWIVFTDTFSYPQTIEPISPKVKIVDLKVGNWDDQYKTRWERFIVPKKKFVRQLCRMQRFVNEIHPDILISVGQCEKFILPLLHHTRILIREIHFNSTYRYFTAFDTRRSGWKIKLFNFIDYKIVCRMLYNRTYLLTKQDKEENFPTQDYMHYMNNPSSFPVNYEQNNSGLRAKTVISVGRLNHQKDYPSMIRAWSSIAIKYPDWKLRIIGEGPDRMNIEKMIDELGLQQSVELAGMSLQVDMELRNASIYAMTSKFEGFALVLVEAMACRLPIVTFDFIYGARDIVSDGEDGFLVCNRNEEEFAQRLEQLIVNESLRTTMAQVAEKNAERFSVLRIAHKWQAEFSKLIENKDK